MHDPHNAPMCLRLAPNTSTSHHRTQRHPTPHTPRQANTGTPSPLYSFTHEAPHETALKQASTSPTAGGEQQPQELRTARSSSVSPPHGWLTTNLHVSSSASSSSQAVPGLHPPSRCTRQLTGTTNAAGSEAAAAASPQQSDVSLTPQQRQQQQQLQQQQQQQPEQYTDASNDQAAYIQKLRQEAYQVCHYPQCVGVAVCGCYWFFCHSCPAHKQLYNHCRSADA